MASSGDRARFGHGAPSPRCACRSGRRSTTPKRTSTARSPRRSARGRAPATSSPERSAAPSLAPSPGPGGRVTMNEDRDTSRLPTRRKATGQGGSAAELRPARGHLAKHTRGRARRRRADAPLPGHPRAARGGPVAVPANAATGKPEGAGHGERGHTPTKPPTAEPAAASGTLNPLCRVLCTLRSVYLCAIGPAPVISLAMDTPRTSSGSPKQLYSREPEGPAGGGRRAPWFTGLSPYRAGSHSRALERHGASTRTGAPTGPSLVSPSTRRGQPVRDR